MVILMGYYDSDMIKEIREQEDEWNFLVIKYSLWHCYENKEKIASMIPPDIDGIANEILGNLQEIQRNARR